MQTDTKPVGLAMPADATPHLNKPCCGVLAVSIAAKVPFKKVWSIIAKMKRRPGAWKGITFEHEQLAALRKLGVAYKTTYPGRRTCQLRTWINRHMKPGVTYLVTTTGHIQVVRDGWAIDQGGVRKIAEQKTRADRAHVKKWFEVIED